MAELFLADDTVLKRRVVLKRVLPYLTSEPEFLQMFLDEARIAAQLQHPNIVETFELGSLEGQIFLSMEFVDGVDLRKLMQEQQQRRAGPLPTRIAAGILQRVAGALGHAHSAAGVDGKPLEVIHRDVSPQNVMVGYDGQIKLVDFGIAKATSAMALSQPGVIKGKFLYLSPEQLAPERLDTRSDLFAFGSMLYETSTGKAPFQRQTTEAIIVAIRAEDPLPLQEVMASYPPELAQIVMRCLEKNRETRYQSGFDIERALQTYLARHGGPVTTAEIARYIAGLLERPVPEGVEDEEVSVSAFGPDSDEATSMARDADLLRARTYGQMPAVRAPGTMEIPVRRATSGIPVQGSDAGAGSSSDGRSTPRGGRPALVAPPVQRTASLSEFKAVTSTAPRVPGGAVPTGRQSNPPSSPPLSSGPHPDGDFDSAASVVRGPALIRHPTLEVRAVSAPPVPPAPPPATGIADRSAATPSGLTAPPTPRKATAPEPVEESTPPTGAPRFQGSIPDDDDDDESTSLMDLQQLGGEAGALAFGTDAPGPGQGVLDDEERTGMMDEEAAYEPPTGRQPLPAAHAVDDDDDDQMTQAQDFSAVVAGLKDVDLATGRHPGDDRTATESSARDLLEREAMHAQVAKGVGVHPDPRALDDDRDFDDLRGSEAPVRASRPNVEALDGRGFDDERGFDAQDDRGFGDDRDDRDFDAQDDRGFDGDDRGFEARDERGFDDDDRGFSEDGADDEATGSNALAGESYDDARGHDDDDADEDDRRFDDDGAFDDDEDEGTAALPPVGRVQRSDQDDAGDFEDEEDEDTGRDEATPVPNQRAVAPRTAPARTAIQGAGAGSKLPLIIGGAVGGVVLLLLLVWLLWPSEEPSREARPIGPPPAAAGAERPEGIPELPPSTPEASKPEEQAAAPAPAGAPSPDASPTPTPSASELAAAMAAAPEDAPSTPPPPASTVATATPPAAVDPVAPPPASSLMQQAPAASNLVRIRLEAPAGVKVTSEGKLLETDGVAMVPPGPVELKLQCPTIRPRPFTYWIRVEKDPGSVQRFAVKCENHPLL